MACNPAYRQAMDLAWTTLEGRSAKELALCSGAHLKDGGISLPTLGGETVIDLQDRMVMTPERLGGGWGLVALHHLHGCKGWKRDDEWTSFEQLEGARPFANAFRQRAVAPLAIRFGNVPDELLRSGRPYGARSLALGDAAILLHPFPKIRLAIIVWKGDGEIPSGANLLFDRGGSATVPVEDLAELGISVSQLLVSTDR